jgi:hypothetical protein
LAELLPFRPAHAVFAMHALQRHQYIDGVLLADARNPAVALCVTSFPYDLGRDESGNWTGRLSQGVMVEIAIWLIVVVGWLAAAVVVSYLISR